MTSGDKIRTISIYDLLDPTGEAVQTGNDASLDTLPASFPPHDIKLDANHSLDISLDLGSSANDIIPGKRSLDSDLSAPAVRRRKRVPLSCYVCRHRKIKCDRGKPCRSCIALRLTSQCKYESLSTQPKIHCQSDTESVDQKVKLEESLLAKFAPGIYRQTGGMSLYESSGGTYTVPFGRDSKKKLRLKSQFIGDSDTINSVSRAIFHLDVKSLVEGNFSAKDHKMKEDKVTTASAEEPIAETLPRIKYIQQLSAQFSSVEEGSRSESSPEDLVENPDLDDWWDIFSWLPDEPQARQLVKRYLFTANVMLLSTDAEILWTLFDHVFKLKKMEKTDEKHNYVLTGSDLLQTGSLLIMCSVGMLTSEESEKIPPYDLTNPGKGYYIGGLVNSLCLAILAMAKYKREKSIWYSHLLFMVFLCAVYTTGEALQFHRMSPWSNLIDNFVKESLVFGLHRDPDFVSPELPDMDKRQRRVLWRACIFVDTMHSLDLLVIPTLRLEYCDTRIFETPDDNDGKIDDDCKSAMYYAHEHQKMLTEWSLVVREVLHKVIFLPFTKVTDQDLEYCRNIMQDLVIKYSPSNDAKKLISSLQKESFTMEEEYEKCRQYVVSNGMYMLELIYDNVLRTNQKESSISDIDIAIMCFNGLKVENCFREKASSMKLIKHYVNMLYPRHIVPLWMGTVNFLVTQVSSGEREVIGNNELLQEILRTHRFITENAKDVYYCWKLHVLFHCILRNLQKAVYFMNDNVEWKNLWDEDFDEIPVVYHEDQWDEKLQYDINFMI